MPDPALLPARYPGRPAVRFGAGVELRLLHRAMNGMAWLRRRGWVGTWLRHARWLHAASGWFQRLGSEAGAMHEDRHAGARCEIADRVERHPPRLGDEHGDGAGVHGARCGIPPAGRAVDHDDRPGHRLRRSRVDRQSGDRDAVVREFGDDWDAVGHDAAPALIAAAAASASSMANRASSSTSWASIVAEPASSAASARHSRR